MQLISSIYIHFPFCRHLCNYCDFYKHKLDHKKQVEDFEKKLAEQIDQHDGLLESWSCKLTNLETLYIGGGTPSLWSMGGAAYLKQNILDRYGFERDFEFTIEVDPGTWTSEEIDRWTSLGVNRYSFGIQTYEKEFLKIMDREHTMEEAKELLEFFSSRNYNYSIDLMLGLPLSDINGRSIEKEIDELLKYNPNHFSVYILKCRKNYKHYDNLPSDDYTSDEYIRTCNYLESHGYEQYEVSNFAKKGFRSRHNLKYWNYESVAGLGPNATGLIAKDSVAYRYQWKSVGSGYSGEEIKNTSLSIEKLYMKLRTAGGLGLDDFEDSNREGVEKLVGAWQDRGYIKSLENNKIHLAAKGYLMLDSLIDDIFNHLSI